MPISLGDATLQHLAAGHIVVMYSFAERSHFNLRSAQLSRRMLHAEDELLMATTTARMQQRLLIVDVSHTCTRTSGFAAAPG